MELQIKPLHLREANAFVNIYHRHNLPTVGGKFAVGCYENDTLCGVAICGRPTARNADNGTTLEIYRNCTNGTKKRLQQAVRSLRPHRKGNGIYKSHNLHS